MVVDRRGRRDALGRNMIATAVMDCCLVWVAVTARVRAKGKRGFLLLTSSHDDVGVRMM